MGEIKKWVVFFKGFKLVVSQFNSESSNGHWDWQTHTYIKPNNNREPNEFRAFPKIGMLPIKVVREKSDWK